MVCFTDMQGLFLPLWDLQELSHPHGNKISQVALFLPIKSFPQPAEAENAVGEWCLHS